MKHTLQYALFACCTLYTAASAPSTKITINNESHCTFEFYLKQENIAQLSLPKRIDAHTSETGSISFPTSIFEHPQQSAQVQYLVTCENEHLRSLASFKFFIGNGNISMPDYYFKAEYESSAPFLIVPYNEISIRQNEPVVITILDRGIKQAPTEDNSTIVEEDPVVLDE